MCIILINMAALTAGAVFLVRKKSWAGLLPLAFNGAYHFSNAAARNSGWRYLLPADWIFFLYFAGGAFVLINLGVKRQSEKRNGADIQEVINKPQWMKLAAVAIVTLFIGTLPLLGETVFPRLYPPATVETARQMLGPELNKLSGIDQAGIEKILTDPQVIVLNGRILYPRYYGEKEGEEKTGKTGYTPLPYSRYVFMIAGEPDGTIIFPNASPELPLRNAETALVIGCTDGPAINARVVALTSTLSQPYFASTPVDWSCSSIK
jgi:hypothetical protein